MSYPVNGKAGASMAVAEGFESSVASWSGDHTPAEVRIVITRHHCSYL